MNRGPELTAPTDLYGQKTERSTDRRRIKRLALPLGTLVTMAVLAGSVLPHTEAKAALPAREDGRVSIINGTMFMKDRSGPHPFFMESIYRPCAKDIDQAWRSLGANTVIESSCGEADFKTIVQEAAARKMYVIGTYGSKDTVANAPNLIGLNAPDELDGCDSGSPVQGIHIWIPTSTEVNNPYGLPIFENYTSHFADDQAAPDCHTKDIYKALVQGANAVSFDEYYWNFIQCHNVVRPNSFYYEIKDLENLAGPQKLVTAFVEVNQINTQPYSCLNAVNPNRVRNQIMQAVAAGAKGINLFTPNYPDNTRFNSYFVPQDIAHKIKDTFAYIQSIKKALLTGTPVVASTDPSNQLVYGSWKYNDKIYLEAVNTQESAVQETVVLPDKFGINSIDVSLGSLGDHLYVRKINTGLGQG